MLEITTNETSPLFQPPQFLFAVTLPLQLAGIAFPPQGGCLRPSSSAPVPCTGRAPLPRSCMTTPACAPPPSGSPISIHCRCGGGVGMVRVRGSRRATPKSAKPKGAIKRKPTPARQKPRASAVCSGLRHAIVSSNRCAPPPSTEDFGGVNLDLHASWKGTTLELLSAGSHPSSIYVHMYVLQTKGLQVPPGP